MKVQDSYCSTEVIKLLEENGLDLNVYPLTQSLALNWIKANFNIEIYHDCKFYDGVNRYIVKWFKPDGQYGEFWGEDVDEITDCPFMNKEDAINAGIVNILKTVLCP